MKRNCIGHQKNRYPKLSCGSQLIEAQNKIPQSMCKALIYGWSPNSNSIRMLTLNHEELWNSCICRMLVVYRPFYLAYFPKKWHDLRCWYGSMNGSFIPRFVQKRLWKTLRHFYSSYQRNHKPFAVSEGSIRELSHGILDIDSHLKWVIETR